MSGRSSSAVTPRSRPGRTRVPNADFVFGSGRFRFAHTNNSNRIYLTDVARPVKIVTGKDVHLLLPEDPRLLEWQGYPTHQSSWLPLWFLVLYHTEALSQRALDYKRYMLNFCEAANREVVRAALIEQAWSFIEQYVAQRPQPDHRSRVKNLSRILQDVLPYLDFPNRLIEEHGEFLESVGLGELARLADSVKRGESRDREGELYSQTLSCLLRSEQRPTTDSAVQAFYRMIRLDHEIFFLSQPVGRAVDYVSRVARLYHGRATTPRLRLFVGGEPHSGKTVFLYLLHRALCESGVSPVIYRAATDGEGVWSNESDDEQRDTWRAKRPPSEIYAADVAAALGTYDGDIALVDAGGKRSAESAVVARACNIGIVLSRQDQKGWVTWMKGCGLEIVANLRSELDGSERLERSGDHLVGTLAELRRGRTTPSRGIRRISSRLLSNAAVPPMKFHGVEFLLSRKGGHTVVSVLKSKWEIEPQELVLERLGQSPTDGIVVAGQVPTWVVLSMVFYYRISGARWIAVHDHRLQDRCDSVVVFSRDPAVPVGSCLLSGDYDCEPHPHTSPSGSLEMSVRSFGGGRVIHVEQVDHAMITPADCSTISSALAGAMVLVTGPSPRWIHARAAALGSSACGVFDPRIGQYRLVELKAGSLHYSLCDEPPEFQD